MDPVQGLAEAAAGEAGEAGLRGKETTHDSSGRGCTKGHLWEPTATWSWCSSWRASNAGFFASRRLGSENRGCAGFSNDIGCRSVPSPD